MTKTTRPYYHQGCWEGAPEPTIRYESIKANVCNEDGDTFPINVDYYIVDDTIATVTAYDKLIGFTMSDIEYDIRESIKSVERNMETINFAL